MQPELGAVTAGSRVPSRADPAAHPGATGHTRGSGSHGLLPALPEDTAAPASAAESAGCSLSQQNAAHQCPAVPLGNIPGETATNELWQMKQCQQGDVSVSPCQTPAV